MDSNRLWTRAGSSGSNNCPYHDLAREDRDLVCAMNLALMQGVTQGLDLAAVPQDWNRKTVCAASYFNSNWRGMGKLRFESEPGPIPDEATVHSPDSSCAICWERRFLLKDIGIRSLPKVFDR